MAIQLTTSTVKKVVLATRVRVRRFMVLQGMQVLSRPTRSSRAVLYPAPSGRSQSDK
ncbi:hypothetical protein ACFFX0_10235 [Citricoccus parietis]|uniref:Uncharacterized protein n=1 Tax=Citricoccus parietis TaxID=592307 RepID=A0ABV5FXZ8_9MICC